MTTEHSGQTVRVRPFSTDDREALLGLAPRLVIGIAPWRDPRGMLAAAKGWIQDSTGNIGPERAVLVAEDAQGGCVGFVGVQSQRNFTGEEQAYIGELAVAETHEGQGIGRMLVEAAERWAQDKGLTLIVLDTGTRNTRALDFYKHLGYSEEQVRLTKVLPRVGRS